MGMPRTMFILLVALITLCDGTKKNEVMQKIYGLEMSIHADMSYLRETVDTNRVSIEAILQLLNDSQRYAVINEQQPMYDNGPDDDVKFSEELARFKRAFADEKAIAREQQETLIFGISKISEAISHHLDGITDVMSELDTRLTKIEQDIADLDAQADMKSERLFDNISRIVKDTSSKTANDLLVRVTSVVGQLEQTVLRNSNSSMTHNDAGLTAIHKSLETMSNCLLISVNKMYPSGISSSIVRLANATCSDNGVHVQGRVEVFLNGHWGTVCDDIFGENSNGATVVCRSLGFSYGSVKKSAYFGPGAGAIWLDDVKCSGTEDDIFNCPAVDIGEHNCSHDEDVGVICR